MKIQRFKMSSGIEIVADVGGDASSPAVILMHGGGQTRHSWGGAMSDLIARGYFVVNVDARGHGDSDWAPNGDYSLGAQVGDLREIIAMLPGVPALVGASMGGVTALTAVGNSADQIATALVMVDVVPRIEATGAARIQSFMRAYPLGFQTLEEAADAVAEYYPHRPRPRDLSGLHKNLRLRDDGRLHWHWDPRFLDDPGRAEPPQFTDALLAAARGVRIPTLLVRGLQSDIVSEAGVEEFRRYLPALEVHDVIGAGHMVAGDRNDAFNRGLLGFLQQHIPGLPHPRSGTDGDAAC